jgi:hypothetical protein
VADVAVTRVAQGGVVPVTWLALGAELERDWGRPTGQPLAKAMANHLPFYSYATGGFLAHQGKKSQ